MKYRRLLLKVSGESLLGSQDSGIQMEACIQLARAIQSLQAAGLEVAVVIGGGNIFRGVNIPGMARSPADQMGMLATLMNGVALQQAFASIGSPATVLSALECPRVAETYSWRRAQEIISQGHVLIFVGGTGNPYFTTDTAAALRASEIQADALLKATKVDGIYNKDPKKFPDAVKYETISYSQVLAEKLEVMDATSIAMCRSNQIPIVVFNMQLLGQPRLVELLAVGNPGTIVAESLR